MSTVFYTVLFPWFYIASVVTFIMFAYDKHCARFGKWRIPESVLLAGGVLMGAFGALCGMILFNHKTSKKLFYILVPLMLLVQTLAAVTVMMTDTL